MPTAAHIAIPDADNQSILVNPQGMTSDIVDSVMEVARKSAWQAKDFAPRLKGNSIAETAKNIHAFIRKHIRYIEDEPGKQYVKTPARTWKDKYADCKGYSIFTSSVFACLGIPHLFRFTTYKPGSKVPRHVYVVAMDGDREIPIDACLSIPLRELQYTFKQDIPMTEIYHLSGIPQGVALDPNTTTSAELDLMIARERLMLEKTIAEQQAISGFGNPAMEREAAIRVLDQALQYSRSPYKLQSLAAGVSGPGIGGLRDFLKNVADKAKSAVRAVGTGLSNAAKEAVKKIVEIFLPKAAPFFLYLFITNQSTLQKLPPAVKVKRQKAQKLAQFIAKTIGISEGQFMGIVRNGIMKSFGKTPEQVLTGYMKGKAQVTGIGSVSAAISAIISIVSKIVQFFKKNAPEKVDASHAPDPGDFENWGQENTQQYAQDAANQQASGSGMTPINPLNDGSAVIPQTSLIPQRDPAQDGGDKGSGSNIGPILMGAAALYLLSQ